MIWVRQASRILAAWVPARSAALLFLLALVLLSTEVVAQPDSEKLDDTVLSPRVLRQINIMEKVIDQVLVESEYALVSSGRNCRGLLLPGYGAIFVVELSPILDRDGVMHFDFNEDGSYNVIFDDDEKVHRKQIEGRTRNRGRRDAREEELYEDDDPDILIFNDDDDEDEDEDEDWEEDWEDDDQVRKSVERYLAELGEDDLPDGFRSMIERWKRYQPGQVPDSEREQILALVVAELVAALRDYGHTLRVVKPEEWVAIAIFPSDLDWRREVGTRTVIQVKRRDIEAYNDGELTGEAFSERAKIVTQ
jgi:hypothetical protein